MLLNTAERPTTTRQTSTSSGIPAWVSGIQRSPVTPQPGMATGIFPSYLPYNSSLPATSLFLSPTLASLLAFPHLAAAAMTMMHQPQTQQQIHSPSLDAPGQSRRAVPTSPPSSFSASERFVTHRSPTFCPVSPQISNHSGIPVQKQSSKKKAKSYRTGHRVCLDCGRDDTAQWRRGPLGQATLCNACGVRYIRFCKRKAKEEEKKKTQQETSSTIKMIATSPVLSTPVSSLPSESTTVNETHPRRSTIYSILN
jgi:hypothetical protein